MMTPERKSAMKIGEVTKTPPVVTDSGRRREYSPAYDKIRSLDVGEWISVEFDSPEKAAHFRKRVAGHYGLRFRGSRISTRCNGNIVWIGRFVPTGKDGRE